MLTALIALLIATLGVPAAVRLMAQGRAPQGGDEPPEGGALGGAGGGAEEEGARVQLFGERGEVVERATRDLDRFDELDLQELAALTGSPALLQMVSGITRSNASAPPAAAPPPSPPSLPPKPRSSLPPATGGPPAASAPPKPQPSPLVRTAQDKFWSGPPRSVDAVEFHRGTPSADALFLDELEGRPPVLTRASVRRPTETEKRGTAAPSPAPSSGATKLQKVREVKPTAAQGAPVITRPPQSPPLKLMIGDAPQVSAPERRFEVIQPPPAPPRPTPTAAPLRAESGPEWGSAQPLYVDFTPFFALDALRYLSETAQLAKSAKGAKGAKSAKGPRRAEEVAGEGDEEGADLTLNEDLPEWYELLDFVNGFLFDLAQEQLQREHQRMLSGGSLERDLTQHITQNPLTRPAITFRQSQWDHLPTSDLVAQPKPGVGAGASRPRGGFSRDG